MKFSVDKQEKYTLFSLQEEKFDSAVAPMVKAEFITLYQAGARNMIIDLSKVKYVDSSGLSSILVAHRMAANVEGYLVLTHVSDHVMKLVKISKLDGVLNIVPTVEEAVDAIFMADLEREIKTEDDSI